MRGLEVGVRKPLFVAWEAHHVERASNGGALEDAQFDVEVIAANRGLAQESHSVGAEQTSPREVDT
jgi:hypothetical protein